MYGLITIVIHLSQNLDVCFGVCICGNPALCQCFLVFTLLLCVFLGVSDSGERKIDDRDLGMRLKNKLSFSRLAYRTFKWCVYKEHPTNPA